MAEQLFPNVRAGLSYVKNYALRRPYGPEARFVTSKTGLDGGQGSRSNLTEEAVRQWGVPELNSKKDAVRWNLHEHAMQKIIRDQPPVQIKTLTEHVLRHGAWGLGEKGASWLAGELSKDDRAREALLGAYTSPGMSSFVTEGSKAGLIRNRAWTNSALVIHGKPIEAGKHLYGALKNSSLYRGRLNGMIEDAKRLDAEAARPVAAAPAPVASERPAELQEPENGRNYTINELLAMRELFGSHGQPITITNSPTFTNNPVFNNNNGRKNRIGGKFEDDAAPREPGPDAGKKKGKGGKKAGKLANNILASMALLQMGYALGRRPYVAPTPNGNVITIVPNAVSSPVGALPATVRGVLGAGQGQEALGAGQGNAGELASGPRQAALQAVPSRLLLGENAGFKRALRTFLVAHGVKEGHIEKYHAPFFNYAQESNYGEFVKKVVSSLPGGVKNKDLRYLVRSAGNVKTDKQKQLQALYNAARK